MLITKILAVYRTRPVMIVAEMEDGIILGSPLLNWRRCTNSFPRCSGRS